MVGLKIRLNIHIWYGQAVDWVTTTINSNIQVCHWCPGGPSIHRESICVIFQKKNRHIVWSPWLIHFPFLLTFLFPLSRTLITSIKLSALPFVTSLETSTRQHMSWLILPELDLLALVGAVISPPIFVLILIYTFICLYWFDFVFP